MGSRKGWTRARLREYERLKAANRRARILEEGTRSWRSTEERADGLVPPPARETTVLPPTAIEIASRYA